MDQRNPYFFYVCGGRSFFAANPGRKIFEVVRCWREQGCEVLHACGGDIDVAETATGESEPAIISPAARSTWRTRFPALAHSISEYRDIRHDQRMFSYLKRQAGQRQPLLVWERSCRLHDAGLRLARELKVPYVLEWKDHLVDYRRSWWRRRALEMEKQKISGARFIVVESGILKQQLADTGVDPDKILVAFNAIDPDVFTPDATVRETSRKRFPEDMGIEPKTIVAGYLGSYAFYHNTALLIKAAALTTVPNLKFVLIGDGLEVEECRQLARSTGVLNQNLFMLPRVSMEQVPAILCGLDMAILPGSTDIICPIKIQEYMASATATVAPDYACNREVIPDDRVGMLFEPDNAQALADGVDRLAGDAALRSRIADQGRRHVQENFTWQATWGRALQTILARCQHASE